MIEYKDVVDISVIKMIQDYRISLIEMEKSQKDYPEHIDELQLKTMSPKVCLTLGACYL